MLETGGLLTQSGTSSTCELVFACIGVGCNRYGIVMRTTLFVGDVIVDGCDRRGLVMSTTLAREGARHCSRPEARLLA